MGDYAASVGRRGCHWSFVVYPKSHSAWYTIESCRVQRLVHPKEDDCTCISSSTWYFHVGKGLVSGHHRLSFWKSPRTYRYDSWDSVWDSNKWYIYLAWNIAQLHCQLSFLEMFSQSESTWVLIMIVMRSLKKKQLVWSYGIGQKNARYHYIRRIKMKTNFQDTWINDHPCP